MLKRCTILASLFVLLAATAQSLASVSLYTRYNIHYHPARGQLRASYANYVGELPGRAVLPYNTKVKVGPWEKGFILKVIETGDIILFEFSFKHMGMSPKAYQNLILSEAPVQYKNLSDDDKQGIKSGKVFQGMTKEGVKIAWGYPAKHRTPSLGANKWVYWRNRFATVSVTFMDDQVVHAGF